MTEPQDHPDPVTRWAGFGLAAVGGLMLTLSGLCSLGVMVGGVAAGATGILSGLIMAAIFGGPPMLVGFYAARRGLRAWRSPPDRARGQSDEIQIVYGVLLILVSIGGWALWAMEWGLFTQEPGSDSFFYAVSFSAFGAFIAGLIVMLGFNLILGARPQTKQRPKS